MAKTHSLYSLFLKVTKDNHHKYVQLYFNKKTFY